MARKNSGEGSTVVEEQEAEFAAEQASENDEIVAEEPKTKVGDAPATTTVDAAGNKVRKVRTPKSNGTETWKIAEGVDAAKHIGQRGCVIRALQKLEAEHPGEFHTHVNIVSRVEGLLTRCAIPDSVMYHLKGLVADKKAELKVIPPVVPAAAAAAPATEAAPVA